MFVLLSLTVQVPLAVFLGHFYDDRVFMATGYLVSSGFNPYAPHFFSGVFPVAVISGVIPSIGYPPPYPLLLGVIYRASYALTQNIFLYNFAIKIPVIIADIGLAYLVRHILVERQVSQKKAQIAFLLILFNPLILLTTVAWGEIDSLIAVISVAALYLLTKSKVALCAVLFGVAVALKPIALPLAAVPLLFVSPAITTKTRFMYLGLFFATFLGLYFGPFFLAGWRIPLGGSQWDVQVQMSGGMTLFDFLDIFQPKSILPASISFLGFMWIPALLITYFVVFRRRPSNVNDLAKMGIVVMLVFFLTRTWVSEPNVNMILPLILLVASSGGLKLRNFHLAWLLPMAFMFPNSSFQQLFYLVDPSIMAWLLQINAQYGELRFLAQVVVVSLWELFALKMISQMLRKPQTQGPEDLAKNENVNPLAHLLQWFFA